MTQVFFASFSLYAPLTVSYMHIIFPFKEFFIHLFKCVAYIFCFSIEYSHVSISICKHFAMFFMCNQGMSQQNYIFIRNVYFIILTDVLCYKIREFTKPPLLISYRFKSEGLLSGQVNTFTYL